MKLTTRERLRRTYEHRDIDRVAICDYPWASTVERWQREGMPAGADFAEYFDLDLIGEIGVDFSPRYPQKVLETTAEYQIRTTEWGVTLKNWRHITSTPEFLDFTIVDRDSWQQAKARMTPSRDRVNWQRLHSTYPTWRKQGAWTFVQLCFGFDATHSWIVGTERLLMALVEGPQWCLDMFNTQLDLNLAMLEMVWQEGYQFDAIQWCDDLGYKFNQFMSVPMYRELLKPVHRRAIDWAHFKGIKAWMHSCGDIRPFIPEFIDNGLDCLNPLEVKAGIDPLAVKREHGKKLALHGGIDALLWDDPAAMESVIRRDLPTLMQGGGYVFATDHSIPDSVGLADFRRIIQVVKQVGTY
jgi:uroporphyrinogen decarboxylase